MKKISLISIALSQLLFLSSHTCMAFEQGEDIYGPPPKEISAEKNYEVLAEILPHYVEAVVNPWPVLPHTGKILKIGSHGDEVLLLRDRLTRSMDLAINTPRTNLFDRQLAHAVRLYQWRHNLKADGVVGENTLAELNISPEQRLKQIRLNLQRWEDLSKQLNERYILVNIPEFKLHLIDHGQEVLTMRVVVGQPKNPTPEFSSTITRLVFNPYWNIPSRIVKREIIPKYLEDSNYLYKNNIRIFSSPEENADEIPPQEINWQDEEENGPQHFFRQDPGLKNALGLIKFEFQNRHNVYLHDTPAKTLFNQEQRAFSHGCIRLENPFNLVNYLTQADSTLDDEKIGAILENKKTRYFRISHPIPIYITYITAWADDQKRIHFANDIYHRDEEGANTNEQNEDDETS